MTMESSTRPAGMLGHLTDQPKGIYLLFTVEMWERFSFYGMRGMLVLFLTAATQQSGFGWSNAKALNLYGLYVGLVYFTPLVGGYLADHWLGHRRAVIGGAVLMAIGHFLMAGPALIPILFSYFYGLPVEQIFQNAGVELGLMTMTPSVSQGLQVELAGTLSAAAVDAASGPLEWAYLLTGWSFYLAISFIILGNGLFKPNMTTLVGGLYSRTDPRRDSGFTIFYLGINLGAFLANLTAGTVGALWGWHYGFTIAGFGMVTGLLVLMKFQSRILGDIGLEAPHKKRKRDGLNKIQMTRIERNRILAILVFGIFSIVFWTGFEQGGGLLNLFAENKVDRTIFGFTVPTPWFQSLNPLFIMLFAPLISALWIGLSTKGSDPSTPHKFALALALMGAGFVCMIVSALEWSSSGSSHMIWLVAAYLFHTLGELCISPVGLSLVNRLSPERMASLMMGVWFLSFSASGWLAGKVGSMAEALSELTVFTGLTAASFAAALVLVVLNKPLKYLMHDDEAHT